MASAVAMDKPVAKLLFAQVGLRVPDGRLMSRKELLKGDPNIGTYTYDDVINLAQANKGDDPFGLRAEFINLVRLTKTASPQ